MKELFRDLMDNPKYSAVEELYKQYDSILAIIDLLDPDDDTYIKWRANLISIVMKRRLGMIK